MQRLSKAFYLGSMVGGLGLALVLFGAGYAQMASTRGREGGGITALAVVPMLYWVVVFFVLWYRAWAAIQDGHARTTPGKAVGFLLIPFFNLYWAFQAIWGFAKDYNSYVDRHSLNIAKLPEGLFLAYPILVLVGIIPMLGLLASAAALVVLLIMISKICDAVNALPEPPLASGFGTPA
ncbi:hypothetical protein MYX77_10985 [Acidobacteriia bacterium AH_259_A11_L15]|nr:hypothetical protein [Acidobacteriia bacterium AH_259_A11_L15]